MFASGAQLGSAVRAGLPPPAWIAVTGRQKLKKNLAFQQPMPASAYPAHSIAINRAVSEVLSPVPRQNKSTLCKQACNIVKSEIQLLLRVLAKDRLYHGPIFHIFQHTLVNSAARICFNVLRSANDSCILKLENEIGRVSRSRPKLDSA